MELDNIKKEWGKLDIESALDQEKLQRIVRKKGSSAYGALIRWEIFGLIGLVFCLLFAYSLFHGEKLYIVLYFAISCVIGLVWQGYKILFLRKIDMINMPVLKIIPQIIRYKRYILLEIYIGIVWFLGWVAILILSRGVPSVISLIIMATTAIILLLLIYKFYKVIYLKNIKNINNSLEELKDFESEE